MNAIDYALNDLEFSDIPAEVLKDVFGDSADGGRYGRRRRAGSIKDNIRNTVILNKVKVDMDNCGGEMIPNIPLLGQPFVKVADMTRIYTIPFELTRGRRIVAVNRVGFNASRNYQNQTTRGAASRQGSSTFANNLGRMVDAYSPMDAISNTRIEIMEENVLSIKDYDNFEADIILECRIAYSDTLREIRPAYYSDFSEIVNIAVKMYCFSKLSLQMDRARIESGRDWGRYKDIVDGWQDSYQNYRDILKERLPKILLLNDPSRLDKMLDTVASWTA